MSTQTMHTPTPKRYRVGIWFFAALLTLLFWWLGNYVLRDIASVAPFEQVDPALVMQREQLSQTLDEISEELEDARARKDNIETRISASERTLNQLLDIRRGTPEEQRTEDSEEAFAEAEDIFLTNQRAQQTVDQEIADLRECERETRRELDTVRDAIAVQQNEIWKRHRLLLASGQFLFLIPFVLLGVFLLRRYRKGGFAPMVYAFNVAAGLLLVQVARAHFPSRFFKYIALAMAIAGVIAVLVYLIRQLTRPGKDWLLQRYKEAYRAAICPSCHYPIVGENMRPVLPGKRAVKHLRPEIQGTTRPAACPSCGTRLFHNCEACGELRHSLLPHCIHCGASGEEGADAPQ